MRVDRDSDYREALEKFEPVEDLSIVVAPDYHKVPSLAAALVDHCTRLQNRIVILHSCPDGHTQSGLCDTNPPVDSPFSAFYLPWINIRNPASGQISTVPPSGHIAGVYARVDAEHGVHKSPANEVLRGVESLEFKVTESEQEAFNAKGVNTIREFPGRGVRIAGARTTATDPEWRYVAIRRYISYLQQSINKGLEWVVFEPNGEQLWGNVQATISDFLYREWLKGALAGVRPEDAYFVKVDRTTMTQDDILNGRLVVIVGVAPLKPAEFVIIRIGHWTAASKD